ncbi:alkane 1-monooxygenase [Corynebacterium phocae]|uniref:Alkane 1-monooxygenase n=1 Tax=Corynebacterium phocae TaxID=161895 RepID=A0A1L7D2A9_9CORY|nr:LLM class flavin-dependent oxidoreductase [Corynebacterium phocae]APT92101.1 alkane 1-monooxygenase [Corynebacterium phocae]KAA8726485.1 LLM class flavin-dependent oxidoreductase [Corynebacterium phocae]
MTGLSLLDFCHIYPGETAADSFRRSVELAQQAEARGFQRIWYTEHHNMPHISSSAPAVLIAHVAAHTSTIRLGSGGVMLPNHVPYVIAEQFGTLAQLHPGRIDLGVGRAPGTDMNTVGRALRRDAHAADRFAHDVEQLRGFLSDSSPIPGVRAVPGAGTNVPVYILGSSMFGAGLAARLGLPFAFASHFAPTHLREAASHYRNNFEPSQQCPEPYLIAGINVLVAEDEKSAEREWDKVCFRRVKAFVGRGRDLDDGQVRAVMDTFQGRQILDMLRYNAVGEPEKVKKDLLKLIKLSQVDELMIALQSTSHQQLLSNLNRLSNIWFS